MDKNVKDAIEVGGFINTWGKIVGILGIGVVTCVGAYYMLLAHEQRLNVDEEKHEKDIQALRDDYKRQYSVNEEKANQKFEQGMKVANELKAQIDKQAVILREHDKEIGYMNGWREAEKFYKSK